MPPIDYTIPGQFQRVQLEPPENAMMRAMQLRGLQESTQMNALKMQEYQRAREEENALRRLFGDTSLDKSSPEFINRLYEKAPGLAPGIEKNILERGKTAAEVRYKDAQAKKEAADTLTKKLEFHQKVFNPLAVTTPDEAAAHAAAFFDDPDFAPYATKMMTREQAIAKSRELFKTNKRAWLDSQLTLNGDKILEATERREKELRADQKAAYSNYVRASVLKNPDAAVLSEEEFLAQRTQATAPTTDAKRVYGEPGLYVTSGGSTFYGIPNAAAGDKIYTPAAAPTTVPTAASADGQVATVAADGTKTMPAVVLEDPNLIEPAVAALLATGDPRDKELAQMIEKRIAESRKRNELTGDFQNVVVAEQMIAELEKNPTPLNLKKIASLRQQIKAANEGRATRVQVGVKLPEGVKAVDQKYAQDYLDWRQGGGTDAAANAGQIKSVLDRFAAGERLSGPSIGLAPDFFNALMNPQALGAKQQVEEVVQRNLRAVLGAQFTQVEGERLISRAFDARLSPQENTKRLRKLFMQIQTAAEQKEAMAQYYEANETLRGFKGKQPKMQDFFDVLSTPDAPPKGSVDVRVDGRMKRFKNQADLDAFKAAGGKVD